MMIWLGLAVSLGILVDDAIVIRENIQRHLELGRDPRGAVRLAVAELRGPLTAATFASLPGFVALAFAGGLAGQYFLPFAVTVAAATLLSSGLALTHPPLGMRKATAGRLAPGFDGLAEAYHDLLAGAFEHRGLVAAISITILLAAAGQAARHPPELMLPSRPVGVMQLELRGPDATTLTGVARRVTAHLDGLAGVAGTVHADAPVTPERPGAEPVALLGVNLRDPALRLGPRDIMASLDSVPLPPGYRIAERGQAAEEAAAFPGRLVMAMGVALILVYLALVLRFGSYRLPLGILLTLPLAPLGAVTAILLGTGSLTLPALVGVLFVVGIAVRHTTLLLACSVRRRNQGLNMRVALIEAGRIRLRPVLLSTLALGLGSIPLLALGGEIGLAFGLAMLGGMVSAALTTLVVVPVVAEWLAGRERREPAADVL